MKEVTKQKKEYIFEVLCVIAPFLWGGFHELSAYLLGLAIVGGMLFMCLREKRIYLKIDVKGILLFVYTIAFWCSVIVSIDKGVAFLGAVKFTVPFLFFLFLMQLDRDRKEKGIHLIPTIGVVMVLVCIVVGGIPEFRAFFFQAGRLGGFFQYSNVMALYLLIGIIVLGFQEKYTKKTYVEGGILLLGIMLTGSRTVFVLMFFVLLYFAICKKQLRSKVLIALGVIVVAGGLYTTITSDFQNIGRFLSISLKSSTLLGRILYNVDGIALLGEHPFGLGYMGYYSVQPAVQTGVYTTMFVHNEWLQTALDAGIVAAIALLVMVIGSLFLKQLALRNKLIIIVIAIHMFLDFDIQYLAIFFILILMMDEGMHNKEIRLSTKKRMVTTTAILGVMGIALLYLGLVSLLSFAGFRKMADVLYPFDSRVKTELMLESTDVEKAERFADEILRLNEYSYAAYNIKAVVALENEDFQSMIKYKQQALAITRYDIKEYQDYMVMLNKAIDNVSADEREAYIKYLLEINHTLKKVKDTTHPIAYEINDKPELEFPKEYQNYIMMFEEQ